jgi:hypothetical protein
MTRFAAEDAATDCFKNELAYLVCAAVGNIQLVESDETGLQTRVDVRESERERDTHTHTDIERQRERETHRQTERD